MTGQRRVVVGITGTAGTAAGVELLRVLRANGIETHLVVCTSAGPYLRAETGLSSQRVATLADRTYHPGNLAARISSGSFLTLGMAVVPCSARTLAAIATGFTTNLVQRAADVVMKEGRRLVLGVDWAGLGLMHLSHLARLRAAGATLLDLDPQDPATVASRSLVALGVAPGRGP